MTHRHTDVPATPVYTVVMAVTGPTLDGEPIDALPGHDDRMAALAELRRRAALRGRPVRVTAKEPDGRVEHFLVGPDGDVVPLPHGHPEPQPEPAPTPPAPQPVPHPTPAPQQAPAPQPRPAPKPTAPPQEDAAEAAWREQADTRAAQYEQRARTDQGPDSTEAVRWSHIRHQLRTAPAPWAAATDLWTASLADGLTHLPADSPELRSAARTAYDCWRQITDPAEAADTGPRLLGVLKQIDYPELLATVEHWTAKAAAVVASWAPPAPGSSVQPETEH